MSETAQQTIFGTELQTNVELQADGRVIRPFKRLIDEVADEVKFRFEDDGPQFKVVDPANVIMTEARLYPEALADYRLYDKSVIGLRTDYFGSALQHARYGKSNSDSVKLKADARHLETTVTKQFAETDVRLDEHISLIAPDSIRGEPDLPDLEFEYSVSMDAEVLAKAIGLMETGHKKYVRFKPENGLVLCQQNEETQRRIKLDVDLPTESEGAMFTGSYVESIQKQINNGLMDTVTLKWSDEFPIFVEMEREDVYEATTMIAPRVKQD